MNATDRRTDGRTDRRAGERTTRRPGGQSRRAGLVVLLVLAVWPCGRLLAQSGGDSIVARAVVAYDRVTTMRADFVQTITDPMLGTSETTRGEFFQQRPDRMAMRWRQPAGDLLVMDGRYLWVYLPSSVPGQVIRSEVAGRPGQVPDPVAEFLHNPSERFDISPAEPEPVGGRPTDVVVMVPRRRNLPYRRVQLWLDQRDALPRRVEITEASGAVRRITFEGMRVNVAVPASVFTFTPPAGVRVVDATQ